MTDYTTTTSAIKCAPSNNLNVGYPQFSTAKELHTRLLELTSAGGGGEFVVRNFVGVIVDISVGASTVETDLFPKGALEYYTKKNMGWDYTQEEYDEWQLPERGGAQGDYRDGMPAKIANVIDCLRTEPLSKRAVIPIPFNSEGSAQIDWTDQGQNKCCRELHLYLEEGKLKCTGIVRMQNANIFVKNVRFWVARLLLIKMIDTAMLLTARTRFSSQKNFFVIRFSQIHFFATLIDHVAKELNVPVGEYTHWITNVCYDRSATSC
jgi:hypothetical protein